MLKKYSKQKTIAIITARGGSKRLPKKNLQPLLGKPLIWYAIHDAKKSRHIKEVYVSTEDTDIAKTSRRYKAKVVDRPMELATDTATSDSVLEHAIKTLNFSGNIVLLQPDTPIRDKDIDLAIKAYYKFEPSVLVTLGPDGRYDGAIWIFNTEDYKKANYQWRNLTHVNPYVYAMSFRKSKIHIHYEKDLKEAERLTKISDEEYQKFSFEVHLAKETEFADKIGSLSPYINGSKDLELLKKENLDLYKKLRDNPERTHVLSRLHYGKSCIDVGCSEGLITLEIAKNNKNCSVLGIDIRRLAIDQSNALLLGTSADVQKRTKFIVAMPEKVAKEKQKFDTVVFTEVLEHIEPKEHDQVLRDLIELMKKNSNLIISVPNRYPAQIYEDEERQRWDAPAHRAYFGKSNFHALLSKYFSKIKFYTLPKDKNFQDGIWLIADCTF